MVRVTAVYSVFTQILNRLFLKNPEGRKMVVVVVVTYVVTPTV